MDIKKALALNKIVITQYKVYEMSRQGYYAV